MSKAMVTECFANCDRCGSAVPSVDIVDNKPLFKGFSTSSLFLNGLSARSYYLDADPDESGFFVLCDDCLDELSCFMSGSEVVS